MDVQSLRYALTLAEELHFGRSARLHFISEQPFGAHIRRLETQVRCQIFNRTSRRVSLTAEGERFISRARVLLAHFDELAQIADEGAMRSDDVLRIGVLGFGAGSRWNDLSVAVREQCPDLAMQHHELDLDNQFTALLNDEVDVALVQHTGSIDGAQLDVIGTSPRAIVVPVESAFAAADSLTMSDVSGADWLAVTQGESRVRWWAGGTPSGSGPEVRFPSSIPGAVAMTGRVSLFAAEAERYFPNPAVRFVPFEGAPLEYAVATRADDTRRTVAAFRVAAQSCASVDAARWEPAVGV